MAKIESICFSLGLVMAGLLVLSTVAPLPAPTAGQGGGVMAPATARTA